MSYEHFGVFLRELRESRNLTREQLAKDICTPKQIYRIEKGDFEPSLYLLNQLSIKFNMDLNEYFKMYFSVNTVIGFEGIQALNDAIAKKDTVLIKSLVEKYEKHKDFSKGENLQHICYAKAICAAYENSFTSSLNHCLKGIMIENPSFSLDTIIKSTYSNVGLSIISCMGLDYISLNRADIGVKVLFDLLYVLENYVLSSPYPMYQASQFSKKVYQNTLNNLSYQLLNEERYEKAEQLIEKGINFSIQENSLRFLPGLFFMKFKLLYKQGNYEKAKEIYEQMRCLYTITKQTKVLEEMDKSVDEDYPRIFQTIGTNISSTDITEGLELDLKEEPGKDSNESNRKG
ncbi:helix-turn-helix domain-containing protein [Anaerocolumna jejuensis]|uniref:helix-turn-helix domain-containing protein n=1 Tax=Anaerocolumna jejuensis TaxID=259063 RepID=UPI003F7C5BC7